MAITPAFLGSAQLTTSAAAVYTAPTAVHAVVKKATFTNTSGSAVTLSVYRVPSGGSALPGNTVISAMSLAAGQAYVAQELDNVVLGPGDSIEAFASAATAVVAMLNGFTY